MESHLTCVFLCKYIHPVIFFNTFCSTTLLLVIGRLHKTPGTSLTAGKLWHMKLKGLGAQLTTNPADRLCEAALVAKLSFIQQQQNNLTFNVCIHSRYLMLGWKSHTQTCSDITCYKALYKEQCLWDTAAQGNQIHFTVSGKFQLQG